MSDTMSVGTGAAAIRHGEVRFNASLVKLMQATQKTNDNVNPVTVVTAAEAAASDNNLGKLLDVKA